MKISCRWQELGGTWHVTPFSPWVATAFHLGSKMYLSMLRKSSDAAGERHF